MITSPPQPLCPTATAGAAVWHWKANCGPGTSAAGCPDSWGLFYGDPAEPPANSLAIKPTRQKYVARIYPQATAGKLRFFQYEPANGGCAMEANATQPVAPGTTGRETAVFIPAHVDGAPWVTGAAVLDREVALPDGSRMVYVAPTGRGDYTVSVTPKGGR